MVEGERYEEALRFSRKAFRRFLSFVANFLFPQFPFHRCPSLMSVFLQNIK